MSMTFKVLSVLLNYPTAELQQAVPEMRQVLEAEKLLPRAESRALGRLLDEFETGELYDLQERYVLLFDRTGDEGLFHNINTPQDLIAAEAGLKKPSMV